MGQLMLANPGIRVPDLGRMLGQMWRVLPEQEKEDYRLKYLKEKETFDASKRLQIDKLSEKEKLQMKEDARIKRKRKRVRQRKKLLVEFDRPKPDGVNPYILYVKSMTLERGDAPLKQYLRGLGEFWKKMPEEDKQPFVEEAKANSAKYRLKMADWERKMIGEGHDDLVRRSALRRPTRSRKAKKAITVKKTRPGASSSSRKKRKGTDKKMAGAAQTVAPSSKTASGSQKSSSTPAADKKMPEMKKAAETKRSVETKTATAAKKREE